MEVYWKEKQEEYAKWKDDPKGGGGGGRGKRKKKKKRHYGDGNSAPEEREEPKKKRVEKRVEQIVYHKDPNEVGEDDADVVNGFGPLKRSKQRTWASQRNNSQLRFKHNQIISSKVQPTGSSYELNERSEHFQF